MHTQHATCAHTLCAHRMLILASSVNMVHRTSTNKNHNKKHNRLRVKIRSKNRHYEAQEWNNRMYFTIHTHHVCTPYLRTHRHLETVQRLGQRLKVRHWEDWYNCTVKQVKQHGGNAILSNYYNGSLVRMLQTNLPQHSWLPFRFKQVPRGFWEQEGNTEVALEWLTQQLQIKDWQQWYNVTSKQIRKCGGGGLLECFGNSPALMLTTLKPNHPWLPWKFNRVPNGFWENKVIFALSIVTCHYHWVAVTGSLSLRRCHCVHQCHAMLLFMCCGVFCSSCCCCCCCVCMLVCLGQHPALFWLGSSSSQASWSTVTSDQIYRIFHAKLRVRSATGHTTTIPRIEGCLSRYCLLADDHDIMIHKENK